MKNLSYFENINKIYFIGIGGISQSALACIMKANGFEVCGSDIVKSETTKKLESCCIKVNLKQKATNINQFKPDLVVYSGAIKKNNEELKQAKNLNIACLERSKFISKFLPFYKNVISISGTHGKSTTTCMISETFSLAGLNPTMHLGAESVNLNSNFLIGDNKFFINEACEYRKSFLDFKSTLGVILNIEEDHPDCYKDINEVNNAFGEFYNICEKVIINEGYVKNIENLIDNKTITFSLDKGNFVAKDIIINENGTATFKVYKNKEFYSQITLNIFAKHNVYNALASIAVCDYFNIDKQIIKQALENFKGIKRRFEKVDSIFDSTVYFDYAHHPTEIKKLLEEVQVFNKPIICVFQPHTYSRTKKFFDEFLSSFDNCYQVVFYKTYSAREKELKGGRSKDLYFALKEQKNVYYYNSFNKIVRHLKRYAKVNNIVLFVGAGDIYNIKSLIEKKNK